MQLSIDFDAARAQGEQMADLCADKAQRNGWDAEGAGKFIVSQIVRNGAMSGEDLTDAAIAHGFRPHDARAFGSVFGTLARRQQIRCVGYCERKKGHGTAGGRIWDMVR